MSARGRYGARRLLLQALYQHQVAGHDADRLLKQFSMGPDFEAVDGDYFVSALAAILERESELDERIAAAADRPAEQLDPVEHAVLWIGLNELLTRPDIPRTVTIDEAIKLAREFGAQDSYRYINALLDAVATDSD